MTVCSTSAAHTTRTPNRRTSSEIYFPYTYFNQSHEQLDTTYVVLYRQHFFAILYIRHRNAFNCEYIYIGTKWKLSRANEKQTRNMDTCCRSQIEIRHMFFLCRIFPFSVLVTYFGLNDYNQYAQLYHYFELYYYFVYV